MKNRRAFWLAVGIILIFCLLTRLSAVQHGLPDLQVVDENSDLSTALRLTESEIPARHVRYHRSLIAYINVASVGGLFGYSYLTGRVGGLDDFRDLYFSDRAVFVLATRLTFVGLTTLAVLLVALTGRYINDWVGILAAGVLAVNGFYFLNSLYAIPDALVMVAVALCLWLAMRLWRKQRALDYLLAGLSVSIVMLSKFNGLPVGIGIAVAHTAIVLEAHQGNSRSAQLKAWLMNRNLLWLVGGIVIGNLVFNPIPFLYPADLVWELQRLGGYAYGTRSISLEQRLQIMSMRVTDAVTLMWRWLIPASALGAMAAFNNRRSVPYWIIVSAFVATFLTIANITSTDYKVFFWTPWLIPMSLLSAIGIDSLRRWFTGRGWGAFAYAAIVALFVLEGAFFLHIWNLMRAADTRELARAYIVEQFPPNTRILTGDPLVYAIPMQRHEISIMRARQLGAPDLLIWNWWLSLPEDERPAPAYDLYGPEMQAVVDSFADVEQMIQDEAIEYVIEVDYCNGTQNRAESDADEEYPAVIPEMHANWRLVAVFSPYGTDGCDAPLEPRTTLALQYAQAFSQQIRSGPLIQIYQTNVGG